MRKTILVISNYENTVQWSKYYEAFRDCGYKVEILVFSSRDMKRAQRLGFSIVDFRELKNSDNLTISISADKNYFYSRQGFIPSKESISNFASRFYALLNKGSYKFVFGEKTWPFELIMASVCEKLQIPYYSPTSLRIPENIFFFSSTFEVPVNIDNCVLTESEIQSALDSLRRVQRPTYFFRNNNFKFIERLFVFISNCTDFSRECLTRQTFKWKISNYLNKLKNLRYLSLLHSGVDEKFCFYVHVQPEASVDYLGDGIRSLDEIIDWLSNFESSSGEGDKMSFKFHSNFAGQFQNFTEKHTWVRRNFGTVEENLVKGILPVTVSGTVALEALWLGYPAVVLGKPYFEGFHGITKIRSYDDFKKLLSGQLHLETVSKDRLIEDTVSFLQSCYNVDSSKSLVDYVKQL